MDGDKTFEQIGWDRLREEALITARILRFWDADIMSNVTRLHYTHTLRLLAENLERAVGVLK